MVASLEEQTSFECFKSHKYISMLMRKSFVEYYHHSSEGNDDENDRTRKLEEFLSCLDEERVKIDAFKRQLPLSTQLLNSAVETSKQLLLSFKENREQKEKAMLKEFIPIAKQDVGCEEAEKVGQNVSDNKANWMASAQLWCQSTSNNNEGSAMSSQDQTKGGAFSPFIKDQTSRVGCDLGLMVSTEKDMEDEKCFDNGGVVNEQHVKTEITHNTIAETRVTAIVTTSGDNNNTNNNNNSSSNNNSQTKRKERRCWSPELHRKFVNALQMLGGSQVATPKQIRELMKIDGLTNDEVKSHLQKYRLHTRRPNCLIQQTHQHHHHQQQPPQLVVLGGIWVPQEYANTYNGQPVSSHYFLPPPPTAHHHHLFNNNNSTATTVAAGTRMEFESKANAVERSLESGEDGDEESNESEITLKI